MDTREVINLRVLQQHDPTIRKILKQSPYVVLYSYSLTDSSWSKMPFEGTLFVYETNTDRCGYRILNRLNLECFSRSLDSEEDVTETEGYVIHKGGEDIWGIWIWDSEDRMDIYASMRDAARRSETVKVDTKASFVTSGDSNGVIDIATLFGPARKDTWTPTTITN